MALARQGDPGIVAAMTSPAATPSRPAKRRRPFGVVVICGLLIFQASVLTIGAWALAQIDTSASDSVILQLNAVGLNPTFLNATDTLRFGLAILTGLAALTFLQVILVFMLRRAGWALTMLLVGVNLALQLWSIWKGEPVASTSLVILSLTALYLNQAEVRVAFGLGNERGRAGLQATPMADEPA